MRLFNYCWFFFFLSFNVSAADYTWTNQTSNTRTFASASSACYDAAARAYQPSATVQFDGLHSVSETIFYCKVKLCSTSTGICSSPNPAYVIPYSGTRLEARRSGSFCPSGTTYDAALGACLSPPPPSCPVGQKPGTSGQCEAVTCTQDGSGSPVVYSPKQSSCVKYYNLDAEEMCAHAGQTNAQTATSVEVVTADPDGLTQTTDKAMACGINVTKKNCTTRSDGKHKCVVEGTYNGQFNPNGEDNIDNCPTQNCTAKPPETPKPELPKPETSTDSKPCNYTSVNGALECVSSSLENKEGTKNCGSVNGAWTCLKVPPTSNGISILTKVTTEATSDGGTKTTKTDTATQTKCTDIGKCTTSTTTNVNVTVKDAQGNTTSITGTCKGDNCPDENGNPDANGDGFGDCVGDDCGGGSGGPSNAELEEVPTFGQTTQSLINRVKSSNVAQSLTGITVPSSGVCPTYSVETHIATVEYESHCEIVETKRDLIKVIMRAVWAFVAILFFFGG